MGNTLVSSPRTPSLNLGGAKFFSFRSEYLPIFGLVVLSLILQAPRDDLPASFDHPRPLLGLGHLSLLTLEKVNI